MDIKKGQEAPIVEPSLKEKKVFKSLEIELLNQVVRAMHSHKYVEAYVLLWTSVEQFMLPALIGYIVRNLKLTLPARFAELQISQVTRLYYFISHDKELFLEIEKIRKSRNKLIHKMYAEKSWVDVKTGFRKGMKEMTVTLELLRSRLSGETPIPSLQIYSRGWNDAIKKTKENIQKLHTRESLSEELG